MTWTLFEHNFGPNETEGAPTHSGQYRYVAVQADREAAIEWWKNRFDQDPTRYDGWPDTGMEKAWDITTVTTRDALLDIFPDIEMETGGIGVPKTRPTRMEDLRNDDATLVAQPSEIERDIDLSEKGGDTE